LAKRGKISPLNDIVGFFKFPGSTKYLLLVLLFTLVGIVVYSQEPGKTKVEIIKSNSGRIEISEAGELTKLFGDVILKHENDTLFCDSAYFNKEKNSLEAFGSVRIAQPGGTEGTSDYLRYVGDAKTAYMRGNVSLTDGKSDLWCEELTYDLNTRIGIYKKNGTLRNEGTVVSSREGIYNLKTKDSRFTGNVNITDPEYNVVSEDIAYNTETKVSRYYAYSIVTTDKTTLITSNGTYDATGKIGHFIGRSSIQNESQYIEGDTLDYSKVTGFGKAVGNVIALDTAQQTTLYCGIAHYNERSARMKAWIKPVLKKAGDKDTLYVRSDTFFSAPVPKKEDSVLVERVTYNSKKVKAVEMVSIADSLAGADSTRPKYFIAYHNVKIFSDSLQGRCDSLSYSQVDSVIRLMLKNPVAWSRKAQISGDTILIKQSDSNKIKWMYIPNNAFMVSLAGPDSAGLYDQIQGRTLLANFNDSTITDMLVQPSAESIYYSKDDGGAYIGVNQGKGERMFVFFGKENISRIRYEQDVTQVMTPLDKANLDAMKLDRFQWRPEERPRNKEELFE
jgi:lipopolysaccharide export system protein LptA